MEKSKSKEEIQELVRKINALLFAYEHIFLNDTLAPYCNDDHDFHSKGDDYFKVIQDLVNELELRISEID